jgi:hypothetical protein
MQRLHSVMHPTTAANRRTFPSDLIDKLCKAMLCPEEAYEFLNSEEGLHTDFKQLQSARKPEVVNAFGVNDQTLTITITSIKTLYALSQQYQKNQDEKKRAICLFFILWEMNRRAIHTLTHKMENTNNDEIDATLSALDELEIICQHEKTAKHLTEKNVEHYTLLLAKIRSSIATMQGVKRDPVYHPTAAELLNLHSMEDLADAPKPSKPAPAVVATPVKPEDEQHANLKKILSTLQQIVINHITFWDGKVSTFLTFRLWSGQKIANPLDRKSSVIVADGIAELVTLFIERAKLLKTPGNLTENQINKKFIDKMCGLAHSKESSRYRYSETKKLYALIASLTETDEIVCDLSKMTANTVDKANRFLTTITDRLKKVDEGTTLIPPL